ncbi:MAG: Kelch repeat-containing protein, partial [Myxococcota bacterium]
MTRRLRFSFAWALLVVVGCVDEEIASPPEGVAMAEAWERWRAAPSDVDRHAAVLRAYFPDLAPAKPPPANLDEQRRLSVEVPSEGSSPLVVTTRGHRFEIALEGAAPEEQRRGTEAVAYGEERLYLPVGEHTSTSRGWQIDSLEEAFFVLGPRLAHEVTYRIRLPAGARDVEPTNAGIEFRDAERRAVLRVQHPVAHDSSGVVRRGRLAVRSKSEQEVVIEAVTVLEELRFPVVIDPLWSATTTMATPRRNAAAALLPDGRLWIAGGENLDFSEQFSSTERYDPATNTWTAGPDLPQPWARFEIQPLPDGQLLFVGGITSSVNIATKTYLYNPSNNGWTEGPLWAGARADVDLTLLPTGDVLLTGGLSANATPLRSTDRFRFANSDFSADVDMQTERHRHNTVVLPNGSVLVAGGKGGGQTDLSSVEVLTVGSGSTLGAGALTVARSFLEASILPSGQVLVSGGFASGVNPSETSNAREVFDASGARVASGALPKPRRFHAQELLPSGHTIVVGGYENDANTDASDAQFFGADGTPLTPAPVAPVMVPRTAFSIHVLADGTLLLAGGRSSSGLLSSVELLYEGNLKVEPAPAASGGRREHQMAVLPNGVVLVAGGITATGPTSSVELFDPASSTWSPGTALPSPRYGHRMVVTDDGTLLLLGGADEAGAALSSVLAYDEDAGAWQEHGTLAHPRIHPEVVWLSSRELFVTGGEASGATLSSWERYSPVMGRSARSGTMLAARVGHRAAVLADGSVVVVGGRDGSSVLSTTERYTLASDSFTAGPALVTARGFFGLAPLPDGRLWVVGGRGSDDVALSSTEVLASDGSAFAAGNELVSAVSEPTTLVLPSGNVLVAGGSSAMVYTPQSGVLHTGPSSPTREGGHALALPNGDVLWLGGNDAGGGWPEAVFWREHGGFHAAMQPVPGRPLDPVTAGSDVTLTGATFRGLVGVNVPTVWLQHQDGRRFGIPRRAIPGSTTALSANSLALTVKSDIPSGAYALWVNVDGVYGGTSLLVRARPQTPLTTAGLQSNPATLEVGGAEATMVQSDFLLDAYGAVVADGSLVTVTTTGGAIDTPDVDAVTPGHQVASSRGKVSLQLRSDNLARLVTVSVKNLDGAVLASSAVDLRAGAPTSGFTLTAAPNSLLANGAAVSTVTSSLIKDAYNNLVEDGELFTIDGALVDIVATDADVDTPGVQVGTVGAKLTLSVRARSSSGTGP